VQRPHAGSISSRHQLTCLPTWPVLQSCDGWKEVAWNGEKLDVLRARFQSHMRKAQARKAGAATALLSPAAS
jgi:hypothetical protein